MIPTQPRPPHAMDIEGISHLAQQFKSTVASARSQIQPDGFEWYPYGSLDNFHLLDLLLTGDARNVFEQARGRPVADIGAADGETSLFLESLGFDVDVIDFGPTNFNTCRGIRALIAHLDSGIRLHEVDLDAQFSLPREEYGLTLLLGILYHLKNPYYALEKLARHSRGMLLSTRIARFNRARDGGTPSLNPERFDMASAPLAYLVAPDETNGDATNYWIFSEGGLRRVLDRCGWDVECLRTFGAIGESDPATATGDERAFCFARSRHFD